MAGEIFISYRRSDLDKARLLHGLLKQRGVDAWYDAQVGAGEDWRRATAKALDAAPIFVLLFSRAAAESDDIGKELAAATFSKKLVIPVRIEDIKPSGEFLYELASRNWFDAFEDTEARFEILADKLAELAKGGAGADVAANQHSAPQPVPAFKSALKSARALMHKRPFAFGGLAAALAVAALMMFAFPTKFGPANSPTQLIAVFEFTTASDDTAARTMAETATNRMFEVFGSGRLNTVARTETRGTPESQRFARASELGALYALSGDVRSDAQGMTVTVRLEDVPSRRTLWERGITLPDSDFAYLPTQASLRTFETTWCIVKTRSESTRDTPELVGLIANRCREGAYITQRNAAYVVGRMRDIVEADPGSAYNQAQLVMTLGLGVTWAPEASKASWIAEAETALQRAIRNDPNESGASLARICLELGKDVPMGEFDAVVLDAMAQSEGKDEFVFGQANAFRARIMRNTGRFREALSHRRAAHANDPVSSRFAGIEVALIGQAMEARAELEPALGDNGPQLWSSVIPLAIFMGAADSDAMLRSPPSNVPELEVACLRDIKNAYGSSNRAGRARGARRARMCGDAGAIAPGVALASLAALDDLDGAFALADEARFSAAYWWSDATEALFWPTSRAMRADPRFLPLVEKVGLMDFWRTTRSQPDVCETEAAPFCLALRAANAAP